MKRAIRHYQYLLLILLVATYSVFISIRLLEATKEDDRSTVSLDRLSHGLYVVKSYYYDDLSGKEGTEKIINGAINGMLGTLDPHTNYIDPSMFKYMTEEQEGKFGGIGIQFNIRDGYITVIAAIDDTPASRLGIMPGDKIVIIEGEDAKNWSTMKVIEKLRGEIGSKVNIKLKREGLDELLPFTITRAEIPQPSVPYAFMLDDRIGYIRISNFNKNTREELVEKINELTGKGMTQMLVDLRRNPGGLLNAATDVSQVFLPAGASIVYTKGRMQDANMEFFSQENHPVIHIPLIVLVDEGSASASEIVAGAIQDHDRGLVIGTQTFGKGLVQRLYPIRAVDDREAALQITTAKYYTPSGRCIQKPFASDQYQLKIEDDHAEKKKKAVKAGVADVNEVLSQKHHTVFYTDGGRKVYGGGGITPDHVIKPERYTKLMARFLEAGIFFDFAVTVTPQKYEDLQRGFHVNDDMLDDFRDFAADKNIQYTQEEFDNSLNQIKTSIRKEIASYKWKANESQKMLVEGDEQVTEAITHFKQAEDLLVKYHPEYFGKDVALSK